MLTLEECQEINDLVRELFKSGGPKSSNKIYIPGSQELPGKMMALDEETKLSIARISDAKHVKRLEDKKLSRKLRLKDLTSDIDGALSLIDQRGARTLAGNCGEMAVLAAGFAVESDPKAQVYKCSLGEFAPGFKHDHCFCLAQPSYADLRKDKSPLSIETLVGTFPADVRSLAKLDRKLRFWVIDPWLNVACEAADYFDLVEEKLKKWDLADKRILFAGHYFRPTDKGYVNAFENSKVVAIRFTAAMKK